VYPMASPMYHHIFRYSIQPLLEVYLGIKILVDAGVLGFIPPPCL
jgi:hypothetical protein